MLRGPCAAAQRNATRTCSMASAPSDRSGGNGAGPAAVPHDARAAAAAAAVAAAHASSLRTVPGIGPKNEQLLVARGHSSLDALQQHFSRDVRGDTAAMARYLRVRLAVQKQAKSVLVVIFCGTNMLQLLGKTQKLYLRHAVSGCALPHWYGSR